MHQGLIRDNSYSSWYSYSPMALAAIIGHTHTTNNQQEYWLLTNNCTRKCVINNNVIVLVRYQAESAMKFNKNSQTFDVDNNIIYVKVPFHIPLEKWEIFSLIIVCWSFVKWPLLIILQRGSVWGTLAMGASRILCRLIIKFRLWIYQPWMLPLDTTRKSMM